MSALQDGDDDSKPGGPELVEGRDRIIELQLGLGEYVVYAAPVLLAEVALVAALVAGVSKASAGGARHWLTSAIRHTWAPALVAGLFLIVAGVAIQWALPDARSIGDVWRQIR